MENSTLIFYFLFTVMAILFVLSLVFSGRSWKWFHITTTLFVFAGSVAFLLYATALLKTRMAWGMKANEFQAAVDRLLAEKEKLSAGTRESIAAREPSLRSVFNEHFRLSLDRARVWRACAVSDFDPASFSLKLEMPAPVGAPAPPADPAADPAAAPVAAPTPKGIEPKAMLYLFAEGALRDSEGGAPAPDAAADPAAAPDVAAPDPANAGGAGKWEVPTEYLGWFQVTSTDGGSIQVKPFVPLDSRQKAMLTSGIATATVFEKMPQDSHEAFAALAPDADHEYGPIDTQQVQKLIPQESTTLGPEAYSRLIEQFVLDGVQFDESKQFAPEDLRIKVKFLKDHEIEVDGTRAETPFDFPAFDEQGRAIVAREQAPANEEDPAAGKVKFLIEDVALLDVETAQKLIAEQVCVEEKKIYSRPLWNFGFFFKKANERFAELDQKNKIVDANVLLIVESSDKVGIQDRIHVAEKQRLAADLAGYGVDLKLANGYVAALENQKKRERELISFFFNKNQELAQELAELQKSQAAKIHAESNPAPAPTPPTTAPADRTPANLTSP